MNPWRLLFVASRDNRPPEVLLDRLTRVTSGGPRGLGTRRREGKGPPGFSPGATPVHGLAGLAHAVARSIQYYLIVFPLLVSDR